MSGVSACAYCGAAVPEDTVREANTVTITKAEYEILKDDSKLLNCLYRHGVDNWEGYEDALDSIGEDDE